MLLPLSTQVRAVRATAGLSLTELLVALVVVLVLAALLLPAIQAARESSRSVICANHLRQIGMAFAAHEVAVRHYPPGGWGFRWVGDPDYGSGEDQPGGWTLTVLPYLDRGDVYHVARNVSEQDKPSALGRLLQMPVSVLVCPSRRKPSLYPFLGQLPLHNAVKPALAFKNDYAGCGGDTQLVNGPGPDDDSVEARARYDWPDREKATGIFFARSRIRIADIVDGLTNTYIAGEKNVRMMPAALPEERDFGDDQAAYMGDDRDSRRWTATVPVRDDRIIGASDAFGSRHPSTWKALFCDGAIRTVTYTVDLDVHRSLGNRRDGAYPTLP